MSEVRPFPARVVRQDSAARLVSALVELPDGTPAVPAAPTAAEPAAYDEAPPALYVYRQQRAGESWVGVVCEVAVGSFVAGRVKGHEAVQARRVEALVHHHATTTEPPALVALLHHPGPRYAEALAAALGAPPVVDFAGPDGLQQTVWRVPDDVVAGLADELGAAELYIADGHHRVAATLTEWHRAGQPADAGLLCVVHAMDGLHLSAFHRRAAGPVGADALRRNLESTFSVVPVATAPAPEPGTFGLYAGGSWSLLHPHDTGSRLDVEVLQTALAALPDLAVEPTRAPVAELAARCDADGGALFTLAPPPLERLTGLADAGGVMPPKTTYFDPKPCAGIFLRP